MTLFFRLLAADDKAAALGEAIASARRGRSITSTIFAANHEGFHRLPRSPLAYWTGEAVRQLFSRELAFDAADRSARVGMHTSDDFRFMRSWTEVSIDSIVRRPLQSHQDISAIPSEWRASTIAGSSWTPIAKGGVRSPYYADFGSLVNWRGDGRELKAWASSLYGGSHWSRLIQGVDYYFRPGMTWPIRGIRFSAQVLPAGSAFSVAGKMATSSQPQELPSLLGLMNSSIFDYLIRLFAGKVGGVQYESGLIGKIPVPRFVGSGGAELGHGALACINVKRDLDKANELSHVFHLPALLQSSGDTLAERITAWGDRVAADERSLAEHQSKIDDIAFRLYGISDEDRRQVEAMSGKPGPAGESERDGAGEDADDEDEGGKAGTATDGRELAAALLSYAGGCAFGRWDVRLATGERVAAPLPDPFAPLPVCSPGMLTGADGLPLDQPPPGYPLRVATGGIVAEDADSADDLVRRLREAFELLFGDRALAIEQEACDLLGAKSLREHLHRPAGFFADHLKRYSRSRRQAPIYWPLSTASGSYTLWLYYHRLDADLLYRAVNDFVEPKLGETARLVSRLEAELAAPGAGSAAKARQALDAARALFAELEVFRAELLRVAALPYRPNLDDGVLISAAPLWKLFRLPKWRKDLEACWKKLEKGDYDWAHLAYAIWPERVRDVCRRDRSIAIAHGLESICKAPAVGGGGRGKKAKGKAKAATAHMLDEDAN